MLCVVRVGKGHTVTPNPPFRFVRAGRPATANKGGGSRSPAFTADVQRLFLTAGGSRLDEPLYGIVYYVAQRYRPATDADADNVSKPVWDALEGVAYDDDKLVRLRIAGVIAPTSPSGVVSSDELDLFDVPGGIADEVAGYFSAGEAHILYVEVGLLRPAMFRFGFDTEG